MPLHSRFSFCLFPNVKSILFPVLQPPLNPLSRHCICLTLSLSLFLCISLIPLSIVLSLSLLPLLLSFSFPSLHSPLSLSLSLHFPPFSFYLALSLYHLHFFSLISSVSSICLFHAHSIKSAAVASVFSVCLPCDFIVFIWKRVWRLGCFIYLFIHLYICLFIWVIYLISLLDNDRCSFLHLDNFLTH